MVTVKGLALRGLAAGAAAGLVLAVVIRVLTERSIDVALRFEDAAGLGMAAGDAPEFTRGTQMVGGMVAAVLFGAVLGLVLGVVVAALHHRLRGPDEFTRAAKVAAGAWVAITLIPGLKYPPNPPAVGDPDTIGSRTSSYLLLMAASVAVVFGIGWLWNRLTLGGWTGAHRFGTVAVATAVVIGGLYLAFPASPDAIRAPDNEGRAALVVADDAPASVLDRMAEVAADQDDGWIRDRRDPSRALDTNGLDGDALRGAPVRVSTDRLVARSFTTNVWRFRLESMLGLGAFWALAAIGFGLLADGGFGSRRSRDADTVAAARS